MSTDPPRKEPAGRRLLRRAPPDAPPETPAPGAPHVRPSVDSRLDAAPVPPAHQPVVFGAEALSSQVPHKVSAQRAWGAAAATVGAVIATALAVWIAAFQPVTPRADPTAVALAGLPDDVVAALSAIEEDATPCHAWSAEGGATAEKAPCVVRRKPPPAAPRPADATIILPEGHPYHRWQISCGSTSTPPPVTSGALSRGADRVVVIPDVPPTTCRVTLAGPGSPPVYVRAGSKVTCRLEGNLVCTR